MKIVEIEKYNPGLTQIEAIAKVKAKGLRLLTNKEADAILQDEEQRKKYSDYFPLWTGTKVEYSGEDCTITELGETTKCKMPKQNGWYEQDSFGIPFGEPSNSENKNARYLYRRSQYVGLLARCYYYWDGYNRRVVIAYYYGYIRLGVLAVKDETKIKNRPLTSDEKKEWKAMLNRLKELDSNEKISLSEKVSLMKEEFDKMEKRLGD